jgi:chromate transporter
LNIYLDLFLSFAQAGACTFGGGYAMLPILQREMVQKRHWVTDEELADYYAIGQCTPGIIAVNTATFVGVKLKGTLGGIVATLGVVFPSLVIITVIAAFLRNFADLPVVAHAFAGIRACVCVLIFNAVLKLKKSSVIDLPTTVIFLLTFLLSALWGVSPAIIVLVAGVVGLSITLAKGGLKK